MIQSDWFKKRTCSLQRLLTLIIHLECINYGRARASAALRLLYERKGLIAGKGIRTRLIKLAFVLQCVFCSPVIMKHEGTPRNLPNAVNNDNRLKASIVLCSKNNKVIFWNNKLVRQTNELLGQNKEIPQNDKWLHTLK